MRGGVPWPLQLYTCSPLWHKAALSSAQLRRDLSSPLSQSQWASTAGGTSSARFSILESVSAAAVWWVWGHVSYVPVLLQSCMVTLCVNIATASVVLHCIVSGTKWQQCQDIGGLTPLTSHNHPTTVIVWKPRKLVIETSAESERVSERETESYSAQLNRVCWVSHT